MRILIMADIHGNEQALQTVLQDNSENGGIEQVLLLGDLINYGMHSNEVIRLLKALDKPVICNIHGNHERAVLDDEYSRFSAERGKECARYTRSILTEETWDYLRGEMRQDGKAEFSIDGKKCLAVHGSLKDIYWKSITPETNDAEYQAFDYVFSGHSHLPHMFEVFYPANDPQNRNKKKTVFINPGSVGQPRNLNPMAQFAVWDTATDTVEMKKVPYDIEKEQSAYTGRVDDFYRERLTRGV